MQYCVDTCTTIWYKRDVSDKNNCIKTVAKQGLVEKLSQYTFKKKKKVTRKTNPGIYYLMNTKVSNMKYNFTNINVG